MKKEIVELDGDNFLRSLTFVKGHSTDTQVAFTCSNSATETVEQIHTKLTIKTTEGLYWRGSVVMIVKYE